MRLFDWLRDLVTWRESADRGPARQRHSLHIGVNVYRDSPGNALRGCVNDAENMRRLLVSRGYAPRLSLIDQLATKSRILDALAAVVRELDTISDLVITWSSHGVQVEDSREPDGLVEALCPEDCMIGWPRNLITAYDLAAIFRQATPGARILLIADTCHSSIDPDDTGNLMRSMSTNPHYRKARALILPAEVSRARARARGLTRPLARSIAEPGGEWRNFGLFAAAAATETAADAFIGGSYQGAFTANLIECARRNPGAGLVDLGRAVLASVKSSGYGQTPAVQGPREITRSVWF